MQSSVVVVIADMCSFHETLQPICHIVLKPYTGVSRAARERVWNLRGDIINSSHRITREVARKTNLYPRGAPQVADNM